MAAPKLKTAYGTRKTGTEDKPLALTLYLDNDLQADTNATGVFFHSGYKPSGELNIVLYLHGHNAPRLDRYWNGTPYNLREKTNEAYNPPPARAGQADPAKPSQSVVLVAPELTFPFDPASMKADVSAYLDDVVAAIAAEAPDKVANTAKPTVRNLVLAAHSGGGFPMRLICQKNLKAGHLAKLREVWGFDCVYGPAGDPGPVLKPGSTVASSVIERQWADIALNSGMKLIFYAIPGAEPGRRCENLQAFADGKFPQVAPNGLSNVRTLATSVAHEQVPATHWRERLVACALQ